MTTLIVNFNGSQAFRHGFSTGSLGPGCEPTCGLLGGFAKKIGTPLFSWKSKIPPSILPPSQNKAQIYLHWAPIPKRSRYAFIEPCLGLMGVVQKGVSLKPMISAVVSGLTKRSVGDGVRQTTSQNRPSFTYKDSQKQALLYHDPYLCSPTTKQKSLHVFMRTK